MPWRLAFALQQDGWILRSDILWLKKAPMPESVTDRPTSAHEHIFLLSKAERYYYDADAVREPHKEPERVQAEIERQHRRRLDNAGLKLGNELVNHSTQWRGEKDTANAGRNLWSYWLLSPEPYNAAHFATFPTEIPRRAILAGTSERGVCSECGAPWRRVVERSGGNWQQRKEAGDPVRYGMQPPSNALAFPLGKVSTETTGWLPTCKCNCPDTIPATVLDPFSGAGTTLLVAQRLGRRSIGIELNSEYCEMAEKRIQSDPASMNMRMELLDLAAGG